MQRYTEAFDVEGTKKKIRNFVRKVVREHPEMLSHWNELMDSDIDTHDDYGEVQLIQDMFKPYGGRNEMSFEKETNSFSFIIPLFTKQLYPDYDDRMEVKEEIGKAAKEFFGTEDIEAYSEEVWNGKYCFAIKVSFGNSYMTPKRIFQAVIKKRIADLGTLAVSYDSYINSYSGDTYGQKIPMKMAAYVNEKGHQPIHTLIGYSIFQGSKTLVLDYIEDGEDYTFEFKKGDTSEKLYNELIEAIQYRHESRDNGGY